MLPARLITFEGLDNCGKTTQIERLGNYLTQRGIPFVVEREPGGTSLGNTLRRVLKNPAAVYQALNTAFAHRPDFTQLAVNQERTSEAELFLFLAARAEFIQRVLQPNLTRGISVIADRFMDSTEAYQGGGLYNADPRVIKLIQSVHAFLLRDAHKPDFTFLLDIPYSVMVDRSAPGEHDFIEQRGQAYFDRVRAQYQAIARREPERVCLLDGTQSIDAIFQNGIVPRLRELYRLS